MGCLYDGLPVRWVCTLGLVSRRWGSDADVVQNGPANVFEYELGYVRTPRTSFYFSLYRLSSPSA